MCVCACVSLGRRQLGRVRIQDQLLEGSILYMCIFTRISHSQSFILICQRGEQDEAAGAACMSAEFLSVLVSGAISAYTYCTCVFVHVPAGNPCAASLQAGPSGVELWQPCLCWVTGFSNSLAV